MAIYSDLNQYTPTKSPLLGDIESVYLALNNLFFTRKGERIFLPEYGSELDSIIFELIDEVTSIEIYRLLIEAIERWEPRVILNYGMSTVTPKIDEHVYEVTLVFRILGFDEQQFQFKGEIRK